MCNQKDVFDVPEDMRFRRTLTVPSEGFYQVQVGYTHSNWDAWLKMEIRSETGKVFTCIPPLPRKESHASLLVYLFAGDNRICLSPRFDQPVTIHFLEVLGEAQQLMPQVIPSSDRYYLSDPQIRRLTVISYTGAPLAITEGDTQIPFELEDKTFYDHADPVETKEPVCYYHLRLHPRDLPCLEPGLHRLTIRFPENKWVVYGLTVERERQEYAMSIVSLDVNHGNCVLLRLPNGKNMLIDTGVENCARDVIFPYLEHHGIGVDYCLISHYHGDHMGSLDAVLERYPMEKPEENQVAEYIRSCSHDQRAEYLSWFRYLDNKMLCRYDRLDQIWDLGGVEITVLNSAYERDGNQALPGIYDENETSVSMIVSYRGFRYYHGADNHAPNQRRNLEDFRAAGCSEKLQCHYMQANHHFHGDLLPEMIRAINPVAVYVPAHQAIFSRSAYMVDYLQGVVESDYPNKRLQDTFVSYTSGSVTVRINSDLDWYYETC